MDPHAVALHAHDLDEGVGENLGVKGSTEACVEGSSHQESPNTLPRAKIWGGSGWRAGGQVGGRRMDRMLHTHTHTLLALTYACQNRGVDCSTHTFPPLPATPCWPLHRPARARGQSGRSLTVTPAGCSGRGATAAACRTLRGGGVRVQGSGFRGRPPEFDIDRKQWKRGRSCCWGSGFSGFRGGGSTGFHNADLCLPNAFPPRTTPTSKGLVCLMPPALSPPPLACRSPL